MTHDSWTHHIVASLTPVQMLLRPIGSSVGVRPSISPSRFADSDSNCSEEAHSDFEDGGDGGVIETQALVESDPESSSDRTLMLWPTRKRGHELSLQSSSCAVQASQMLHR